MLHIKFLGETPTAPQVTQFCHLNHLLKKVVRDHDDASLGGWCSMKTRWLSYEAYEMSSEQDKNNKQTCPDQSSLF